MKKIILLLLISIVIYPVFGANKYTTFVDQIHGFSKVYDADQNISKITIYDNNTLNINIGDTVEWKNDADPEIRITIMSDPNLWNESGNLPINYKRFGHNFNKSGIYKIYLKEFPKLIQWINVSGETILKTPILKTPVQIKNVTISTNVMTNIKNSSPTSSRITDDNRVWRLIMIAPTSTTIILALVLLLLVILSGRIKDEE